MAAHPGEDLAATLFADVHYYYGPPNAKPPHHRFDKGSYVYLYENASQRRARLEVANNAGTPDQDAFEGFLDKAHIDYSYKHTTLVTLTVDGISGPQDSPNSQAWRLPTFDPQNEQKYLYKLHTVDLYFWTKEDAQLFVNSTRRVLPSHQLTIRDEPVAPPPSNLPPAHRDDMSPLVQNLENVAISDPSYQNGRTKNSQSSSFPGPPGAPAPAPAPAPAAFAPIAYNPAAPAAPEKITHREKTPPPEDASANPLAVAAVSDHGQAFSPPPTQTSFPGPPQSQPQSQASYFPGPPQHSQNASPYSVGQILPPPPSAVGRTGSFPMNQQHAQAPGGFQTQYAGYPGQPGTPGLPNPGLHSPGFQQPLQSPSLYGGMQSPGYPGQPLQSPGFQAGFSGPPAYQNSTPPQNHGLPPPPPGGPTPPPGGYSQYSYAQGQGQLGAGGGIGDYSLHSQMYRPTEAEGKATYKPKVEPRGKLENSAMNLEKGVTGFLKKLEKKYG